MDGYFIRWRDADGWHLEEAGNNELRARTRFLDLKRTGLKCSLWHAWRIDHSER